MNTERRNDIGGKMLAGIMVALVAALFGVFLQHTYQMGFTALAEASQNTIGLARNDEQHQAIQKTLDTLETGQNEIKSLLMNR